MIWRPEHLGLFLDHEVDDRLYALFCVTACRGLRRGETVGLKWEDSTSEALADWKTLQAEEREAIAKRGWTGGTSSRTLTGRRITPGM